MTITFSGLQQEQPEQRLIPQSYQPLQAAIANTKPEDGRSLGVEITWENPSTSTRAVNDAVMDHTGDYNETTQRGGGVMFGTAPFGMTFSKEVQIPSLHWTFYGPTDGADTPAKIEVYTSQNPGEPAKTVSLQYPEATGYTWHHEAGFSGMPVTKIMFYPAMKNGEAVPLNIDDIQVKP